MIKETEEIGKLWLPYLSEVGKCNYFHFDEECMRPYYTLNEMEQGLNKTDKEYNSKIWWTASSHTSNLLTRRNYAISSMTESYLRLDSKYGYTAVPLCFRFV